MTKKITVIEILKAEKAQRDVTIVNLTKSLKDLQAELIGRDLYESNQETKTLMKVADWINAELRKTNNGYDFAVIIKQGLTKLQQGIIPEVKA